jgi:hypothetical protein
MFLHIFLLVNILVGKLLKVFFNPSNLNDGLEISQISWTAKLQEKVSFMCLLEGRLVVGRVLRQELTELFKEQLQQNQR